MSAFSHNFHTHTARCNHAQGSDREMVLAAMEAGVQVLGFSDHTPYPGISPAAGRNRMPVSQTAEYFASLTALKEEFAGQIELHIGFEAEYLAPLWKGLLDHLAGFPCDYLILGADAHSPAEMGDIATMERTRAWAAQFGLPITDTIRYTMQK